MIRLVCSFWPASMAAASILLATFMGACAHSLQKGEIGAAPQEFQQKIESVEVTKLGAFDPTVQKPPEAVSGQSLPQKIAAGPEKTALAKLAPKKKKEK